MNAPPNDKPTTDKKRTRTRKRKPRNEPLVGAAIRVARAMLFQRATIEQVMETTKLDEVTAARELAELNRNGIGPASKGPYSTKQVAYLMGLTPRRILALAASLGLSEFRHDLYAAVRARLFARNTITSLVRKERRQGRPPEKQTE